MSNQSSLAALQWIHDGNLWHLTSVWLHATNQPLFPGLQWILDGGFWHTFIICLVVCPILPQLLGIVCVGYWAPWDPRYQFLAYMPGNLFLAGFIAGASTTFDHIVISAMWNQIVFWSALLFYVVLNVMDKQAYSKEQLKSANKVYHNLLYWWYGYFAVICAITMWFGTDASIIRKLCLTLSGLVWLGCLVADNFASEETQKRRFKFAHANTYAIWRCWRQGLLIRRRTTTGYSGDPRRRR